MTKNKYRIGGLLVFFLLVIVHYYSPIKPELIGYQKKIWGHKINSIEKQLAAQKYFSGIELDLVYLHEKSCLDVNHPPDISIGLSFSEYLKTIDKNIKPFLWLDIKNLSLKNSENIIHLIQATCANNQYPYHKILIESSDPKSLVNFSKLDFQTSYYLPFGITELEFERQTEQITLIRKALKQQPSTGISSYIHDYELMNTHFPNKTKYLWSLNKSYYKYFFLTQKALRDPRVKSVLISFKHK